VIVHSRGNVGPSFGGVLCRLRAKMKRWCPANVGQGPSKSAGALSLAEARWRCGKAIDHAANLREELFLSRWRAPARRHQGTSQRTRPTPSGTILASRDTFFA